MKKQGVSGILAEVLLKTKKLFNLTISLLLSATLFKKSTFPFQKGGLPLEISQEIIPRLKISEILFLQIDPTLLLLGQESEIIFVNPKTLNLMHPLPL
ncbi:hypothetical protein Glove_177g109 [Diversispora epigaea]|uniref:Uncharacterized protein n=1 Tax=Diversispora epigaea TaxID=1348612 RepID=A0A397IXT6_9GLOM|nr:hypothetical protein Glove_177g109 [Diversispora epigaea]